MQSFDFYVGHIFGYIIMAVIIVIGMDLLHTVLFRRIAKVTAIVYSAFLTVLMFGLLFNIVTLIDIAWCIIIISGVILLAIMGIIDNIIIEIWMSKFDDFFGSVGMSRDKKGA